MVLSMIFIANCSLARIARLGAVINLFPERERRWRQRLIVRQGTFSRVETGDSVA
jgi:hypothetical protein